MKWWLSFATKDEFLGCVIVEGGNIIEATSRAHELKINPGGEVLGYPFHTDPFDLEPHMDKLMDREEAESLGDAMDAVAPTIES